MDNIEFKRIRNELGLTQSQLGEAIDFSANSIARIERGELPLRRVVSMALLYLQSTRVIEDAKTSSDERLSDTYREVQLNFDLNESKSSPVFSQSKSDELPSCLPRKIPRSSPRKKKKRKK